MSEQYWSVSDLNRLIAAARKSEGVIGTTAASEWWPALLLLLLDTALHVRDVLTATRDDYACNGHLSIGLVVYKLHRTAAVALSAVSGDKLLAWPRSRSALTSQLGRIIEAAGIPGTSRPFDVIRSIGRQCPDLLDSLDLVSDVTVAAPTALTLLSFLTDTYAPSRVDLSSDAEEQMAVAVRRLNAFAGHQVEPSEMSATLLVSWMKSMALKGQAAATINGKRAHVLCLWRAAYEKGLAPKPPATRSNDVPLKREPRRLPNSWTVEQMETIVANCQLVKGRFRNSGILRADFLTSLVLFEYETATRLAANLAVRCSDIDLETGLVYLRWKSAKTGIEQVHWLSQQTCEAITAIWDPARDFVWPWGRNRHGLWCTLRAVLKASGLPFDRRCMFHRFRRTTATMMAGKLGMSAAAAALGHTSEAMTRRYVDPTNLLATRPIDVLPRLHVRSTKGANHGNQ